MIEAKVVAHSINEFDQEIATFVVECPRFILAEFNTHRVFSRNSASSRAIPFEKNMDRVLRDPFIPIAWQRDHKGMQGTEYIKDEATLEYVRKQWEFAMRVNVDVAQRLASNDVTKQLCNRLLEPFMWQRIIVTTTDFENFYELRCPKYELYAGPEDTEEWLCKGKSWNEFMESNGGMAGDWKTDDIIEKLLLNKGQAEIHMSMLAEAMYDAHKASTPIKLKGGEWHLPFGGNIDEKRLVDTLYKLNFENFLVKQQDIDQAKLEIATARCARVSYFNYEGKDDYEADFRLFKTLKDSKHMSPFEHCAKAMTKVDFHDFVIHERDKVYYGRCKNFSGFIQKRWYIEQ